MGSIEIRKFVKKLLTIVEKMHNSLHMPKMAYIIGKRVRKNEKK